MSCIGITLKFYGFLSLKGNIPFRHTQCFIWQSIMSLIWVFSKANTWHQIGNANWDGTFCQSDCKLKSTIGYALKIQFQLAYLFPISLQSMKSLSCRIDKFQTHNSIQTENWIVISTCKSRTLSSVAKSLSDNARPQGRLQHHWLGLRYRGSSSFRR